ncbi:hypothetical protein A1O3_07018 [Capronia epimyces CBS 606.96]|uniref:Endoplasmic reticulum junction formation protein lunapark n=1 Tax=Capronia epimyces CBS 606.96 TaxID=1182542 RepID=W9YEK3_9EURO|nr:uncharacterized protein A1O3_07018 [Capronia epimyces CBS 606.96]EXJ80734.1 hypothetical protein A1O3_07018 [Capronia epimyces CBS 606.96]
MSWLWKGDANSPASFEKALSKLSSQITSANLALDTSRSRGRRVKALWTLYTTLTYLLYTLVIVLVLGPQNWSLYHYSGLIGAPVLIYAIRSLVTAFFDWRISRQQSYLDHLQKQREQKITELKKATKYDSTQELLQKYGGAPPAKTPSKQPQGGKRRINPPEKPPAQRTGIAPPPTANIPGRNLPPGNSTPLSPAHGRAPLTAPMIVQSPTDMRPESPGFAPNAFPQPPPPSTAYDHTPHWYDRILDVLLGEDETAAKNRLVLLCSRCHLVNGQAPPGVKTLEELGRWRCSSCGAWNGVESEGAKVVKEIAAAAATKRDHGEEWEQVPQATDNLEEFGEEFKEEEAEAADYNTPSTTGRDAAEDRHGGLTKRATRSAGKKTSLESLE